MRFQYIDEFHDFLETSIRWLTCWRELCTGSKKLNLNERRGRERRARRGRRAPIRPPVCRPPAFLAHPLLPLPLLPLPLPLPRAHSDPLPKESVTFFRRSHPLLPPPALPPAPLARSPAPRSLLGLLPSPSAKPRFANWPPSSIDGKRRTPTRRSSRRFASGFICPYPKPSSCIRRLQASSAIDRRLFSWRRCFRVTKPASNGSSAAPAESFGLDEAR